MDLVKTKASSVAADTYGAFAQWANGPAHQSVLDRTDPPSKPFVVIETEEVSVAASPSNNNYFSNEAGQTYSLASIE